MGRSLGSFTNISRSSVCVEHMRARASVGAFVCVELSVCGWSGAVRALIRTRS